MLSKHPAFATLHSVSHFIIIYPLSTIIVRHENRHKFRCLPLCSTNSVYPVDSNAWTYIPAASSRRGTI